MNNGKKCINDVDLGIFDNETCKKPKNFQFMTFKHPKNGNFLRTIFMNMIVYASFQLFLLKQTLYDQLTSIFGANSFQQTF